MANDTDRKVVELVINGQAAQASIKEVNGELRKLTAEFRKMREADDPEAYKAKAEEVKKLREAYAKMNEQIKPVADGMSNVDKVIGGLPGRFGQAAEGAKGLGVQFLKLLANPIVALIAGITAALTLLFKAFTETDSGGNQFAAVMEQIKSVVNVVMQRVALLAGAVVSLFKGEWSQAADQFKEAVSGVGDQLRNAAQAAKEYIYELDRIEDAEISYISAAADIRNKIAKLIYESADKTKSNEVRRKALAEALDLEKEESEKMAAFAKERYENELKYAAATYNVKVETLRKFIQANDDEANKMLENDKELARARNAMNDDGQKKLEEAYAKAVDADTNYFETTRKNRGKLTGFDQELNAKAEEARQKRQQSMAKDVEDAISRTKQINDELFALRQDEITRELVLVSQKYQAEINQAEANIKKYPEQADKFRAVAAAATEKLKQEQAAIVKKYDDQEAKSRADAEKKNQEDRIKQRDEFLRKYQLTGEQSEEQYLQNLHAKGLISEEEYLQALAIIQDKHRKEQEKKDEEALARKRKGWEAALATERSITQSMSDFWSALKEKELIEAGDNEAKKKEITKKYAMNELLVKEAQILANTAAGIMQAYATLPTAAALPASILIGIAGAAQMATAKAQYDKIQSLGDGGFLSGPSHSNGGIDMVNSFGRTVANAEGGELMLNSRFVANNPGFANALLQVSRINQGNIALGSIPSFDMGGIASAVNSNYSGGTPVTPVVNINNDKLASQLSQNAVASAQLSRAAFALTARLNNLEAKINYDKHRRETDKMDFIESSAKM